MKFFWLLLLTLVVSVVTHDGIGRRRARAASKYDLNPQLTAASHRTAYEAREEQREREAMFGWDDEDDDSDEPWDRPSPEALGLAVATVRVAGFRDPAQAHLLRGRLESTGIAAVVAMPHGRGWRHDVYVAREHADEALAVIGELRQSWGEGEREP